MTITVRGPNGVVINFPDGTDQGTIGNAMRQATGTPLQRGNPAGPLPAPNVPQVDPPNPNGSGSILPVSWDRTGVHFDPHAGILGAITNAATLPGDVYAGKVDPNSDEGMRRATDMGALLSGVNPAVRSGDAWLPGPKGVGSRAPVNPPTTGELYDAASAGYKQARNLGVQYTASSVLDAMGKAQSDLEADGILAENAPSTFRTLKGLTTPPDDPTVTAPFTGIEAARQSLNHIRRDNPGTTEATAAARVIASIDSYLENDGPQNAVAGPAASVAAIAKDARGNYAAASRSDKLTGRVDQPGDTAGIADAAALRAGASNSGFNGDNAIRSRVVSLLLNKKQLAGYSADEIAALRQVAEGTATRNVVRWVGNFLGGGGGLGAALLSGGGAAVGAMQGGAEGAAIGATLGPVVGASAKELGSMLTRRALNQADQTVRARSPLAVANAPVTLPNPFTRTVANRTFIGGELNSVEDRKRQAMADALSGPTVY